MRELLESTIVRILTAVALGVVMALLGRFVGHVEADGIIEEQATKLEKTALKYSIAKEEKSDFMKVLEYTGRVCAEEKAYLRVMAERCNDDVRLPDARTDAPEISNRVYNKLPVEQKAYLPEPGATE